ncbi:hypothetical protein ACOSP7_023230 [Xanthoceras sorbifolium]
MWKDLVVDCLKINIHAAINSKEKMMRLGIIIRNHEGDQVMAVGCQKLQVVYSPQIVEALISRTLTSTASSLPPSSQSGEPQVVDNVE